MRRPAVTHALLLAAALIGFGGFAIGAGSEPGSWDGTHVGEVAAGAVGLAAGFTLLAAAMSRAGREAAALSRRLADREAAGTRLADLEHALRASESRLADTERFAGLGRWELGREAGDVWASPELYRMFGRQAAGPHLTLTEVIDWIHPDDRPAAQRALAGAFDSADPVSDVTARFVTPGGEVRWLQATFHPDRAAAGGPKLTGVVRDVTDELRAGEERDRFAANLQQTQRLEALGVLTGGVAHDFNNLLTGILGNAALAREAVPADAPLQEFLRPIELSADQAAHLCRQMMTYAGGTGAGFKPVDLNRTVRESNDLLRLAATKRVELRTDLAPDLPPADGDPGRLRQVLLNLVQNASEAIGPHPGAVTIRTGTGGGSIPDGRWFGDPPADCVWVEVTDTGCGMDDATRDRIFEPFFTTKLTGRGLGLSAVLGIVREHGGVIGVASRPGRGTTFRVALPALPTPAGQDTLSDVSVTDTRPPAGAVDATSPDGRPAVALVADDEPTVRGLAGLILRSLGFEVVEATTGTEAAAAVRADPGRFTLALLDVLMPELDGRGALTEIRSVRPDLPVVLMSGFSENELRDLTLSVTLQFLQKPFRPADLTACIRQTVAPPAGGAT